MQVERVEYLVDPKGKKRSVVLSLKHYQRLLEDLHDLAIAAERRDEPGIPLHEVEENLIKDGLLPRRTKTKR